MKGTSRNILNGFAIRLLSLAMILCLSSMLHAQSFYGSIVGTVTDATGAVVPNAKVTATNIGTSEAVTVTSDAGGKYTFVNLVPAVYKVDVTKASFKHFIEDKVTVEVGNTVRVDSALQVGAATETVEVSTEAPLLKTDSSTLSTEIGAAQVQEMPLNGRNVLNLIALTPGVVPTGAAMGPTGLNQGTRTAGGAGWGDYEIGGAIQGQSAQFIDGVANNLLGGNIVALVPTQDAIQEFSVASSNAGADFGRFAGGVVNMASKSGGNTFHGSVWEYLRNRDFNANDFFSNLNASPRAQFNQNQYGASLNGPIMRDKAFFMFTWEGYRALTGNLAPTNVPSAAMQNGVFPTTLNQDPLGICNIQPYTGQTVNGTTYAPGGSYIVNLYQPGLKPGTTCGDPTNQIIKTFYPAPNKASASNPFLWFLTTPLGNKQNQYNGRVDYTLSPNDRLFARYTYWTLQDQPHSEYLDQGFNGTKWPTNDGMTSVNTHQAVIGETHTFNASTVSDFHLNFVRQYSPNLAQSRGLNQAQFGAAYAALAPQMSLQEIPGFQLNGNDNFYNMNNYINDGITWYNTYGINGNVSKIAGAHSLKIGGEARLMDQSSVNNGGGVSGSYQYGNTFTGDEFANMLIGYPSSVSFKTDIRTAAYTYYQGYYVQDVWQTAKNLTLTLGLRWELPGAIAERNNKSAVLLPTAVDPYTGIKGTLALTESPLYGGRTGVQAKYNLFAPRVGAAYRVTEKTVVRGGYGITYLPNDLSGTNPTSGNLTGATTSVSIPTSGTPVQLQSILNAIAFGGTINGTAIPAGLIPSTGRSNPAFMTNFASLTNFKNQGITGPIPQQSTYPWVEQWNMSLSHEFKGNLMTEISYNGLHGTAMPGGSRQLDQLPAQYYTSAGTVSAAGASAAGVPAGTPLSYNMGVTPAGSTVVASACPQAPGIASFSIAQCLRPFPYYNGVSDGAGFYGTQNYRSLQIKAEKRMGAAGTIMANYTYARSMGNVDTFNGFLESKSATQGGAISNGGIQDWYNLRGDYSLISYDVTNRTIVAYNLNLPFGKGKKYANNFGGPLESIVSGWAVNGTTTLQSGFPIVFQTSNGSNINGAGSLRPMLVPGCQKTINQSGLSRVNSGVNATGLWFNPGCFENAGTVNGNTHLAQNGTTFIPGVGNVADIIPFTSYQFGNEPRVDPTLRSDGIKNFDFSFQKSTRFYERANLEFRTEIFNIFNRVQFAPPNSSVGSNQIGQVSYQVNRPRQIQLSLRLNY